MAGSEDKHAKQIAAATNLVKRLASRLNMDASVRLWDGSRHPLGQNVTSDFEIKIASPGVITSILRRPSLDTIIRQYINKGLDYSGGSLIDFGTSLNKSNRSGKLKAIEVAKIIAQLRPFLFASSEPPPEEGAFGGNITGANRIAGENQEFIEFHYDLTNAFYELFLDPEMVYSCAYFTDWTNDLATAQHDKLDMICRKLRLKPGDRFLDIGCGWGALVAHAAKNYGVTAHGITLSVEQLSHAEEKIRALGLQDRVTLEFIDYIDLTGTYDKIASVGMYEHIGLDNIPTYMRKIRSLLTEDGLFLNHAISRRAKKRRSLWPDRLRPEQRALAKYIFPGGALDDIGNTVQQMERAGFEVQDVEAWRLHYARTCTLWHDRLIAQKDAAIAIVGEAKYRIYVAYLAGCAISFHRGTARLYQTLASKSAKRPPALPPTRADLYR